MIIWYLTMALPVQIFNLYQNQIGFSHQRCQVVILGCHLNRHRKIIWRGSSLLKLFILILSFRIMQQKYLGFNTILLSFHRYLVDVGSRRGWKSFVIHINNILDNKLKHDGYKFIAIMSHLQRQQKLTIYDIADKQYENRSAFQHTILADLISYLFPTVTSKMAKLMTFYLQTISGPCFLTSKQFSSQSYVITGNGNTSEIENPQANFKLHTLSKDRKVNVQENQSALVLDYSHYLNCQALGQTSIEQQIAFMHSSQFLCSIPKRRLYHILRKSTIIQFTFSQVIYQENQQIQPGESGSGVYLVRKGDFGYFKNSERQAKQIQTLSFSKGHLFGTLQLSIKPPASNRQFTVKCKSHSGLVHRFSEELYSNQIKPYCQSLITSRQSKLSKYIETQIHKNDKIRERNGPLLSQTLARGFSTTNGFGRTSQSQEFPLLTRTRLSIPNVQTTHMKPLLSQRLQQEGLKKTNYFSLTKQGPLKVYPMTSQRSNFTESEFRELTRLQRNKEMCQKVKELKAKGKCSSTKGEILFSFFKQTWNFNKQRKMMLNNQRYA